MIVRTLGRTGYRVSAVAYGGIVSMNDSQADSDRYVAYAVEQGVNYFDVAPTYGDAQQKLGQSLIPYRDRVYLACKTAQRRRREAEQGREDGSEEEQAQFPSLGRVGCGHGMRDI